VGGSGEIPALEVGEELPALTPGSFLARIAARHAEREALVFEGRRLRYRELEAESRLLARALIGAGVVKGARVAVLLGSRPEWVAAFFAVGLVGGVFVPVSTFAAPGELDYVLRHSDASLLLLQPQLLSHRYLETLLAAHPELAAREPGQLRCPALPHLRRVVATELREPAGRIETLARLLERGGDVSEELLDAVAAEVAPSDDGVLIYTSGTTARPKAVLHRQRAALLNGLRFARWMGLGPEDRVLSAQPFFWTAGITMSLVATLEAGACLVLQESFDPEGALELIERERVTTLHAWAHQQRALAEHPSAAARDLSALARLDPESPLARRARGAGGSWGLQGSYGLSETFTIFATLPADAPLALRQETNGRPLPGNALRIVDPETGRELPAGQPGEIAVKGTTLMRGYHKRDPETFLDADGFFHTGDAGFVDAEGLLHWTGRLSHMIKTGGANVSPLEVEGALLDYEPLKLGLAVGVPHPTLDEAVVLCAVRREDALPVTEEQVRAHLRARLAAYKIPRRVLFFRSEELAFTGNQKIQYAPLREKALARLEAEGAEIAGHVYGGRG
jgi:acyl-CoA synthetase (AMP-forming)/AMP-acid ligase II